MRCHQPRSVCSVSTETFVVDTHQVDTAVNNCTKGECTNPVTEGTSKSCEPCNRYLKAFGGSIGEPRPQCAGTVTCSDQTRGFCPWASWSTWYPKVGGELRKPTQIFCQSHAVHYTNTVRPQSKGQRIPLSSYLSADNSADNPLSLLPLQEATGGWPPDFHERGIVPPYCDRGPLNQKARTNTITWAQLGNRKHATPNNAITGPAYSNQHNAPPPHAPILNRAPPANAFSPGVSPPQHGAATTGHPTQPSTQTSCDVCRRSSDPTIKLRELVHAAHRATLCDQCFNQWQAKRLATFAGGPGVLKQMFKEFQAEPKTQ